MVNTNQDGAEGRQVLVNVGNRYVLFGSEAGLPAGRALGPDDVSERLRRVPDEREFAEERLVDSIRLAGAELIRAPAETGSDLVFSDGAGRKILVEIKVRERDANVSDFKQFQQLFRNTPSGLSQEVWNFNIERLHLQIFELEKGNLKRAVDLNPLDVWEYNDDGSVFNRQHVIERVDDWESRINALFDKVERWARDTSGLRTERTRKFLMSEELMQKFAVPDRELPVLDLACRDETIVSLVPIGLWVIGANGRINIITRAQTYILVDRSRELQQPDWVLVDPANRKKLRPFDVTALTDIVGSVQ